MTRRIIHLKRPLQFHWRCVLDTRCDGKKILPGSHFIWSGLTMKRSAFLAEGISLISFPSFDRGGCHGALIVKEDSRFNSWTCPDNGDRLFSVLHYSHSSYRCASLFSKLYLIDRIIGTLQAQYSIAIRHHANELNVFQPPVPSLLISSAKTLPSISRAKWWSNFYRWADGRFQFDYRK